MKKVVTNPISKFQCYEDTTYSDPKAAIRFNVQSVIKVSLDLRSCFGP